MKRISKKNKILLSIILAVLITGIGYASFILFQRSKIIILKERDFTIQVDADSHKSAIAQQWVRGYTDQFKQKYLPGNKKLVGIKPGVIEILNEEEAIVQIDFVVEPKKKDTDYFSDWGVKEGNLIKCQWVLDLEVYESGMCYLQDRMSPAAYQLMIYDISGKREEEESYNEYIQEKPFEKTQYTYKIEGEKLFISYNEGNNWIEVPIDFEELMAGRTYRNQLPDGSYEIKPDKTSILFGGTNEVPLTVLFSDDEGTTWEKAPLLDVIYPRYSYIHFENKNVGYSVITFDKTMGQEASAILHTTDGGRTWENIGDGPRGNLLKEAKFFENGLGFFSYPYIEGNDTNLYRTEDGGKTFEPVIVEPQQLNSDIGLEWKDIFKEANVPEINGEVMTLLVSQGADGDYKGGNLMARYESKDLGKTWIYIDQVKPAPDPNEG